MRYSVLLLMLTTQACASITSGSNQSITVESHPSGAQCELNSDAGTWRIPETPSSVNVGRAASALTVTCNKKGYDSGSQTVQSTTKAAAFGNIIAGDIIGAAADMGTGSAYNYPPMVNVTLNKR